MGDAIWKNSNIGIKVNISDVQKDIKSIIGYFDNLKRSYLGYMSQINTTTVQDTAQKAAKDAIIRAGIRVKGASQKIIDGFYSTVAKNKNSTVIRLSHSFFSRSGSIQPFVRGTRKFVITGKAMYKILDTGRKQYQIVKAGNQSQRSSPLKFYFGRIGKYITYYWKGPKGGRNRHITVKQHEPGGVDFSKGARFTEAAEQAVERMVEHIRIKMMEKSTSPVIGTRTK